jgi:hypothetical protein
MNHDLCVKYRYTLRAHVILTVEQSDQQHIKSLFYFALRAAADPSGCTFKARGCGRSLAEIVGSNTAGSMDVCLL